VREYRDAMDYISNITETLQRLRAAKPRASDDRELLAALAADRIERATSVCLDVIADFDAGSIRHDSTSVRELAEAVEVLQQRLRRSTAAAGRAVAPKLSAPGGTTSL